MWFVRVFLFATGLVSLSSAAPAFSASLTPAQRERLGLATLSPAQLAELDAAVAAFQAGQSVSTVQPAAPVASTVVAANRTATVSTAPTAVPVAPADRPKSPPPPIAAASRTAGVDRDRFTARVVGDFRGWNGGTYFPLDNGQVWRQVGSESNELPPRREAVVEIYPSGNGYWRLRFDGAWITVRRLQ